VVFLRDGTIVDATVNDRPESLLHDVGDDGNGR
jgi:hypothetical protein